MKIFDLNEVNEAKGAAKQKEIKFLFVERSATNQSIKHINQSKTFDWMIEFDWIWLIAAPLAAFNGWFWLIAERDERQLSAIKQINSFLFTC